MTKEDKIICLAMTIGDGHIRKDRPALCISHGERQYEYINWKRNLLENITGKSIKIRTVIHHNNKIGFKLEVSHKYFRILRLRCYDNDCNPIYTRKFLDKLSPIGIAIWYMDDGSLYAKKRNGKIHAYELVISTYCSEESAKNIVDFFYEKYNIKFTIKRNKGFFSVRCGTTEAKKFIEIVSPYVIDCLRYKITI